jgi:hypothetical protein
MQNETPSLDLPLPANQRNASLRLPLTFPLTLPMRRTLLSLLIGFAMVAHP